ncbi:MAG: mevalonate kinase family protein [bacterium]
MKTSSPGRICLFGEHQDYLQLPVIAAAISLRISVEGTRRNDFMVNIALPDIGTKESFSLESALPYVKERDYFRSCVNVLRHHGFTFSAGCDCVVRGAIPINAGTSSSSALVVAWICFLAWMSDQATKLPPERLGRLAFEAEVLEFKEPGGMMDHFSTTHGGTAMISFFPEIQVQPLEARLGTFVLGDSRQPKDTKGILKRVKNEVLQASKLLEQRHPEFSLQSATSDEIRNFSTALSREQTDLLQATIQNRDLTREAKNILSRTPLDDVSFGKLLNEHHRVLRDALHISTPKIDSMLNAALRNGALGGKINGSGGGGCMFAYAPHEPQKVARTLENAGGKAYVVHVDTGAQVEAQEFVSS